ncbi:MAG TPA: hypothetical protein VES36_02115 [Candidatus Limnocylindrales bacterium]|nr:hypothetical protein [Candidatus Limnocylindrales bacterium]
MRAYQDHTKAPPDLHALRDRLLLVQVENRVRQFDAGISMEVPDVRTPIRTPVDRGRTRGC